MDDFPGLLARDFGFRPHQGKSAPMSASKSSSSIGSGSASTRSAAAATNPLSSFDDVFGGPPKYPNQNQNPPSFDSIFEEFKDPKPKPHAKWSSMPVYDKPVYDDDIFEGVPGTKSTAKVEYDDVFATISKGGHVEESGAYDDLLGGLGRSSSSRTAESKRSDDLGGFEELIPGFGGSSPPSRRDPLETNQQKSSVPSAKASATMPEDPFVVLETASASAYPSSGMFADHLEHLGRPMNSGSVNVDASPASGEIFDNIDAFDGLAKSVPAFTHDKNETRKSGPNRSSVESFDNVISKTQSTKSFDSRSTAHSPHSNDGPYERNATSDQPLRSSEHLETDDDVWLTVSEIPLFTQPTSAPPPSRPPPPLVIKSSQYGKTDPRRKDNDSYSQSSLGYPYSKGSVRRPSASPIGEFEDFVMNKPQSNEHADILSSEDDVEANSAAAASAAAMKEAMDRAEAKFKHAKEVRERERDVKSARSREFAQERDEEVAPDTQDWEDKKKQEKIDRERLRRESEEREREQRRLEREREEREKGRQAVERATREARERAAAEARERAAAEARAKADREAVEKANAEARRRAEKAAVQRAQQEARERAAAEARLKAERVAAEAKEKITRERERAAVDRAAAEARQRAERAAVGKANAQARERAAADAWEKAAREKQNKTENDLESFFATNRANSAPKERSPESRNPFEAHSQNRNSTDGTRQTTSNSSNTVRKTTSTPNIVDDLTSIFGGAPLPSGAFKEVEGEPEERRRSRLEKHQKTLERAAKALAEKNERDMQVQRDQAERHRIGEVLDSEIKRWAAGKEGNLRALLSTLQYVLWPECGWQPVSLTDLIEASKVKSFYRKATLCIHPDKVQQKGANIQQKYIAEKVFDLLKEAWNKFNSEELF